MLDGSIIRCRRPFDKGKGCGLNEESSTVCLARVRQAFYNSGMTPLDLQGRNLVLDGESYGV